MEYNEQIAAHAAEVWKVPASTIKTWKARNSIPEKYAGTPIPESENDSYIRMLLTLKDARLDIKEIERKTEVPIISLLRGDVKEINYEQFKELRNYINTLVVTLKRARTLESIADVLKIPSIKPLLILRPLGNTQKTYFSHLKTTPFRSIRDFSYDTKGAIKLFYEFAEQIKI